MRQRDRKKVILRRSLFNIHLARFTAALNQTVEEAYRSLDELIGAVEGENEGNDQANLAIKSTSSESAPAVPRTAD